MHNALRGRMSRWGAAFGVVLASVIGLAGCNSGGSGPLSSFGGGASLAQLANVVLLGRYVAAGAQPGGNLQIRINGTGAGATVTIFDPQFGEISAPATLLLNSDNSALLQCVINRTVQVTRGNTALTTKAGETKAIVDLPFDLVLRARVFLDALHAGPEAAKVFQIEQFSINNVARTATIVQAPATNPLAGKTFSNTFTTSSASGNYTISIAANGLDVTLSGNVTSPAFLAGSFAGKGTVGPPATAGGTDHTLTATAKGTSGLLKLAGEMSFQGKATVTPATITLSGNVFLNGENKGTFSASVPNTGGGTGGANPFAGATIPTSGGATFLLQGGQQQGSGTFRLVVNAQGIPTLTVLTSAGDIKQGQIFTGAAVNPTSGQFSLSGNTGFGSPATITGTLSKSGNVVTLSNFQIKVNGQNAGVLQGGSVSGSIGGTPVPTPTSGSNPIPIAFAVGGYQGTLRNLSESGQPIVANITVRLQCNSQGTVEILVTAPGATFQRSATNTSKTLVGTATYNAATATFSVTVNAFDADPQNPGPVTISGSAKVTASGTNVTASGNLTDTIGDSYSANFTQFFPDQQGC